MIRAVAFTHPKRMVAFFVKAIIAPFFLAPLFFQSCKHEKKIYQSNCNDDLSYKHVGFRQLIDSIQLYDHQYVEIDGTYIEGNEESALVNDSLFADHSTQHALWVNFSQDCPLVLKGTNRGIFEINDGKFTQLNNKSVTIRGKIDVRHKGHLGSYSGSIDRISYVKL
ncbi:hypothetical protein [Mucilaginibacter gotjawali]|uniref:Uncharacterized protein n=2 Tax=Mucilaginibacter gotjawali TaxID=1550579 RepID=A0A0X8X561_9SPHI|nr:hypothetical protein [Mucilaginibacter gotjawali]MBB3059029.1 hypothetical protein [Mucilaginibacter gotjawali]BAU55790.1 hypothetical protein MgSA37_03982 [Mucilaginibacter gotjawali]